MSSTSNVTWRSWPRSFELPIAVALPLALLLTLIIAASTALLVGRWT